MEERYESMNTRNVYYKTLPVINSDLSKERCTAAYAFGDWYLNSSFRRVVTRIKAILGDSVCMYSPVPKEGEGVLHQTLLQCIKFGAHPHAPELVLKTMEITANVIADSNLATTIVYKGLVWTPTGIALAGYSEEEDHICKVRQAIEDALNNNHLPCDIPYKNDILHATLFRWIKQPTSMMLLKLEEELKRWSECTFGELRIARWIVGNGSWRQLPSEREDFFSVPVHLHICHRGNLNGPQKQIENNFGILIQRAIQGMDVEIDVWYHEGSLWLGHDRPEHKITLDWLASSKRRLIHCKDGKTLEYLTLESGRRALDLHLFYHTNEHYAITSKGHILCCPGQPLLQGSLCMMPEMAKYTEEEKLICFSICSDSRDAVSTYPRN
jgi:hypothetical protein